jgi:hypothetical protein
VLSFLRHVEKTGYEGANLGDGIRFWQRRVIG